MRQDKRGRAIRIVSIDRSNNRNRVTQGVMLVEAENTFLGGVSIAAHNVYIQENSDLCSVVTLTANLFLNYECNLLIAAAALRCFTACCHHVF